MNDLTDVLPSEKKNERLSLIFESNKSTNVAIKTPFGITKRREYNHIVQQGGTWGPIKCANTVDSVGKECEQTDKFYILTKAW